MAFKSVLGVLLLLCIAATVEAGTYVARINLGSGHLESNGWGHNRRTFYYHVPKDMLFMFPCNIIYAGAVVMQD